MKKLKALLIGDSGELMLNMPSLLSRSGFDVDVIAAGHFLKKSRFISDYEMVVDVKEALVRAAKRNLDAYDFIIPCDDATLEAALNSEISLEDKLKLIPIKNAENLKHIYSKIGLSQVLSEADITTPYFFVVRNFSEATAAAEKLKYPVMVKVDSSSGGCGVFECCNAFDLNMIDQKIFDLPVLIQKKIIGAELDLSAIYRDGQLLHFTYSKIEKVIGNKFGPSSLRTYEQLCNVEERVFLEMKKIGQALGANGFTTISCIKSDDDNKLYFIEADMRPNVWVEVSKFIGDDPAIKISQWFSDAAVLKYPHSINIKYNKKILIPSFLRLSAREILCNRYNVWKFISWDDGNLTLELLCKKIFTDKMLELLEMRKFFTKELCIRAVKRAPTNLIRLVISKREDRMRIKNFFSRYFIRQSRAELSS